MADPPSEWRVSCAWAGGGLTFAASARVQLDASVDRALGGAGTDWLFGLGTSFRF